MWDHIINIHSSESLSTKTKESGINELKKKRKKCFTIIYKKRDNLYFIPNNILRNFFKELIKYKNDYQYYLNYIYRNYIMHLILYF